MLRELTERPLEHVAPGGGAGEPLTGELLEIGELSEIDAVRRGLEARRRLDVGAERLDRIGESRVTAEELGASVPHLEGGRRPAKRSVQRREAIRVDARQRTGEGAGQIASALEEMKRAVEVAVAADPPGLILEEELAHAREVNARLHIECLLRPVREIDVADGDALRAVTLQVDAIQVNARTVEH